MIEVNQPDRGDRRRRGKTDTIDAEAAARAVLSGRATATAKTGDGPVEMLRMFKLAKASAIKSRTQAINQLKAVLVRADPALRESTDRPEQPRADPPLRRAGRTRPQPTRASAAAYTLRLLARRILPADRRDRRPQRPDHRRRSLPTHPQLLQRYGVGPDTAAALLHRRRRQPRPAAQRGLLRRALRRQPDRGVLGQDPTPPAQPRRRPTRQLRALHDRHRPPALGPTHPRLRRPTHHRGQDPPRGHPLPQALRRPRDLPDLTKPRPHATDGPIGGLTSIGASSTPSPTSAASYWPVPSSMPGVGTTPIG